MKTLVHGLCSILYLAICYEDSQIVSGNLLPIPNKFFSKFVWLTIINLYFQTFYHSIAFLINILYPKTNHQFLHFISRAFVGPLGVTVTILFWGLYVIDPSTLAKDEVGIKIFEMKWFNNGLHTLPLITAHLDLFIYKHKNFKDLSILKAIAIFCTLYLIDIHVVYYISGNWAYPILGELAPPFRLIFIAFCSSVVYFSYLWLSLVHNAIYGSNTIKPKRG